ncbi:MAG TPA: ABC transporter substrate-binding protein [Burkholderiaceae bacterium]|nr:ABC transporter substrate-binding protein [Burkholderiaceae bacterium]
MSHHAFKRLITSFAIAAFAAAAGVAHAQQTLKVGSTPTGVPFTFMDTKTQKIEGAMVDLITAIGEDQGFKVQVEATPFAALIPALTSNRIDLISAAMLITPARKEVIDFSDPVFPYPEGLIVKADDKTQYKSLADLKGQTVGVQVGTVYVDFLKKNGEFAEVRTYDSIADIIRDVGLGRIKGGFGDAPIIKYQLSQRKDSGVRFADTYEPKMAGYVGIGVRKGDADTLKKVNAGLAKMKSSGKLDEILKKWNLQ